MTNWILKLISVFAVLFCISDASYYRVEGKAKFYDRERTPCVIIIETDAILHIMYHKSSGENATAIIPLPDNDNSIYVHCKQSPHKYMVYLDIRFNGFSLEMQIWAESLIKDWHFDSVQLTYSTSNKEFEDIDDPNQWVLLTDDAANNLHLISIGDSNICNGCSITFSSPVENGTSHKAVLTLITFNFQRFHPNEIIASFKMILGSIVAILFVLFVGVCLFFMHENKLMQEPTNENQLNNFR